MNKSKIILPAALLAILIGIIGIIICILPGNTAPDKTVAKYVSALDSGKTSKMKECLYASDLLGEQYDDYYAEEETADGGLLSALRSSALRKAADKLPGDLDAISKIKLLGCVDGKEESSAGLTGLTVTVVLQIDYTDEEGAEHTAYPACEINLIKSGKKYLIIG